MYRFQQKLKGLKQHLKEWNKMTFGNIFSAKTTLEKDMESLQQQIILEGHSTALAHKETELQSQIEERCKQEEMLWKQKSRISWLKEGEHNTSFFHRSTIQHRMHNKISILRMEDDTRLENHKDIET
jgi:hypothetical protein